VDLTLRRPPSATALALSLGLAAGLGLFASFGARVAGQSACLVTTASGDVRGALRGSACTYLGVPYAAAPAGPLRWRPPQQRAAWAPVTLDVTVAPQTCAMINLQGANQGNEDCLTVNIWAPAARSSAGGVPVIVWLHTGAFQAASSNFAGSDGRRFAEERGVIVVAPNYRLGPFGFLAHSALTRENVNYPTSGNYGIADQRAALVWVRDNIAAFGGDPRNVTLAGTSAGGFSTGLHLVTPSSRGLFHRAVVQSGYVSARRRTLREAEDQGASFATALGCNDPGTVAACMRSKTRDQVLLALPIAQLEVLEQPGRVLWEPVVDGVEVLDQPRELYRREQFPRIPVIIGVTGDEGWTYVDRSFPTGLDALQYERFIRNEFGMDGGTVLQMYPVSAFPTPKDALARVTADVEFVCEARRITRALHRGGATVFLYSFDYPVNAFSPGRAVHGVESNLLFGNNYAAPANHVLTAADLVIYDAMSNYWRRFAETGDPNPRGVPVQWPAYRPDPAAGPVDPSRSDQHFVFAERLGVRSHLRDPQCNFWESFYFRSVLGTVPAAAR
jgi:para-nitrobenzyl esterase